MHTYFKNFKGNFTVAFDSGGEEKVEILKIFEKEIEAMALVHFLNGGELPFDVLQALVKTGQNK